MATYTDSYGFDKGVAAFSADTHAISKQSVLLDFAKIIAARAAAGVPALAAADVLQVVQLPAGSVVLSAGANIQSAETVNTTATLSIGFTGGSPAAANVYGNLLATNSTGLKAANAAPATVVAAADTLDVLLNTAVPTNAKVEIFAFIANAN